MSAELKRLRRENAGLRRANENSEVSVGLPRGRALTRHSGALSTDIDEHKYLFGVEPICRTLTAHASLARVDRVLTMPAEGPTGGGAAVDAGQLTNGPNGSVALADRKIRQA